MLLVVLNPKPHQRAERDTFRYFQGGAQVPEPVAAKVQNRSHAITVEFETEAGVVPNGVLLAVGSALGGWSLHVLDGRLTYVHQLYGKERHVLAADRLLEPGRHTVRFDFTKDELLGGPTELHVEDDLVAQGHIPRFTVSGFNGVGVGLTCGYEWGPAVGEGYEAPFEFNGTILRAEVVTTGPVVRDPVAEVEAILSQQ